MTKSFEELVLEHLRRGTLSESARQALEAVLAEWRQQPAPAGDECQACHGSGIASAATDARILGDDLPWGPTHPSVARDQMHDEQEAALAHAEEDAATDDRTLHWFVQRAHPTKRGYIQAAGFPTKAEADAQVETWKAEAPKLRPYAWERPTPATDARTEDGPRFARSQSPKPHWLSRPPIEWPEDLLDGLHGVLTRYGIASRTKGDLVTDLIAWAVNGAEQTFLCPPHLALVRSNPEHQGRFGCPMCLRNRAEQAEATPETPTDADPVVTGELPSPRHVWRDSGEPVPQPETPADAPPAPEPDAVSGSGNFGVRSCGCYVLNGTVTLPCRRHRPEPDATPDEGTALARLNARRREIEGWIRNHAPDTTCSFCGHDGRFPVHHDDECTYQLVLDLWNFITELAALRPSTTTGQE